MENLKAKILGILEGMDEWEKIRLWNEYSIETKALNDCVYSMREFNEIMEGMTPWEIARCCYYSGNFCPAHNYFKFNGYGNIVSSDYLDKLIYIDDFADYLEAEKNAFYNADLQDLFDELEEADDESDDGAEV